jgi:hypothetical protein
MSFYLFMHIYIFDICVWYGRIYPWYWCSCHYHFLKAPLCSARKFFPNSEMFIGKFLFLFLCFSPSLPLHLDKNTFRLFVLFQHNQKYLCFLPTLFCIFFLHRTGVFLATSRIYTVSTNIKK